jgi:cytidylate kinase
VGDFTQEYLAGSLFDESEQGYCVVKRHIVTLHRHNKKNERKKHKKRVSSKANTKSGRRKNLWIQGETLKLQKFLNHSVLNCAAKINIVSHVRKRLYKPARKYANNSDRKFRKFCPISRTTSLSFTALNM